MELPKKVIDELIEFYESQLIRLKKDLLNPLQLILGTSNIEIKIIEIETELKKLRSM